MQPPINTIQNNQNLSISRDYEIERQNDQIREQEADNSETLQQPPLEVEQGSYLQPYIDPLIADEYAQNMDKMKKRERERIIQKELERQIEETKKKKMEEKLRKRKFEEFEDYRLVKERSEMTERMKDKVEKKGLSNRNLEETNFNEFEDIVKNKNRQKAQVYEVMNKQVLDKARTNLESSISDKRKVNKKVVISEESNSVTQPSNIQQESNIQTEFSNKHSSLESEMVKMRNDFDNRQNFFDRTNIKF